MNSKIDTLYNSFYKKIVKLSSKNLNDLELISITSAADFLYNPRLREQKKTLKRNYFLEHFKKLLILIRDLAYVFLSLPALLKLFFTKDISIVWSGDFFDKRSKGDFRLGNFYINAYKKKLKFVEFITTSQLGLFYSLTLFAKRRRTVIYFDAFIRIIKFFSSYEIDLKKFNDFDEIDQSIIEDNFINILVTKKFLSRKLFKNVKNVFIWGIYSRTAGIFYWAKKNNLKTVGIMHGLPIKEYVYFETMPGLSYNEDLKIDYFGVWSNYWQEYYKNNSSMMKNLQISGPLRKKTNFIKSNGDKFLLLVEPLLEVGEFLKYKKFFEKYSKKIDLKVRSDFKFEHLQKYYEYFPFLKNCKIIQDDIDDVLSKGKYKYCIATHSTGILDCLHYGLYPIILHTETWGNYLKLEKDFIFYDFQEINSFLLKKDINQNKIIYLAQKFSNTGDGSEWVIDKLMER